MLILASDGKISLEPAYAGQAGTYDADYFGSQLNTHILSVLSLCVFLCAPCGFVFFNPARQAVAGGHKAHKDFHKGHGEFSYLLHNYFRK
jgi:hypothetical protein